MDRIVLRSLDSAYYDECYTLESGQVVGERTYTEYYLTSPEQILDHVHRTEDLTSEALQVMYTPEWGSVQIGTILEVFPELLSAYWRKQKLLRVQAALQIRKQAIELLHKAMAYSAAKGRLASPAEVSKLFGAGFIQLFTVHPASPDYQPPVPEYIQQATERWHWELRNNRAFFDYFKIPI